MISDAAIEQCNKLIRATADKSIAYRLGLACGAVMRALPGVDPGFDLLDRVVAFNGTRADFEAMVNEWIEVHDKMRRTRLRARKAAK